AVNEVGTAARMAETQMGGLAVLAKNLGDKLGVLAIVAGEGGFAGALAIVLKILRAVTAAMIYLIDNAIGNWIVGFAGATTTVYALAAAMLYLRNIFLSLMLGVRLKVIKEMITAFGVWQMTMIAFNKEMYASMLMMTKWQQIVFTVKGQVKKLFTAIAAHPFLAWAAGITLVITGVATLIHYLAQADQRLEEERLEISKNVKKLKDFRKELDTNKFSIDALDGTLKRIVRSFPALHEAFKKAGT
ncbi:unnamed protein product, partial [marine sediment metagenome]